MKKVFSLILVAMVAMVSVVSTSCSKSNDEELNGFSNSMDDNSKSFMSRLDAYKSNYYLIDIRKPADYAKGHAVYNGKPAINMECTAQNTKDNNSQWCQDLLALTGGDKNSYIFLYGYGSTNEWTYAGRVATLGWEKTHVILLNGGYKKWTGDKE